MPVPTHIAELIKNIPNKAGIYQYYDKKEILLYIGKAKKLKKAGLFLFYQNTRTWKN
jgi:Excinuclease ABC subunit C